MIFEFYAHGTPSLFGEGDAGQAAQLAYFMNRHRALDVWQFREVDSEHGPVMNIANELAYHRSRLS
jgi:hypothetical protein